MIEKITFDIYMPMKFKEIFSVPEDKSRWNENPKYIKNKSKNNVPNRDIYLKNSELIIPKNKKIENFFSKESPTNYGIYILIFNDFRKFYVGVAARYSSLKKGEIFKEIKSPEGFFTRLKKHRAKCTGTSAIGVNYTNSKPYGWRDFALERERYYCERKVLDTMDDCLLSLIVFNNHNGYKYNDKGILEELENYISKKGISNYIGNQFENYHSIAHTNSKNLSFEPIFNNIYFRF